MDSRASEAKKIDVALSFITKDLGGKWATREARLIEQGYPTAIRTMNEFETRIRATFDDPDKATTARSKIMNVKQRGRPFEQFLVEFELLEYETRLGDLALVEWFKRGIDYKLWDECYRDRPVPETLGQWKTSAGIHDRAERRKNDERQERFRGGYTQRREEYQPKKTYNPGDLLLRT